MAMYNLYTYGFLAAPDMELELPLGIYDRAFLISNSGVYAVVETGVNLELLQQNERQLITAVLSHDRVICELFRQTTILPLRFGTCFTSKQNLLTHLEAQSQEYLQKLDEFKDKSEYLLKFISQTTDQRVIPIETAGKQYFLAKQQRYKAQQEFYANQTAQWESAVAKITEIYKSTIVIQPQNQEARIYVLVIRTEETLLADQFLAWQKACPSWKLELGEALPPYHFI
jgi:Gas vesicle synthesis protein GvpL/GvpF